jgi:hypothetical protein
MSAMPKTEQIHTPNHAHEDHDVTEAERNAMRAYLQRTEVRLSTLHRIAVSFVSGAGLMILFPLFIKDEITGVLRVFINYSVGTLPTLAASEQTLAALAMIALFFPFVLSAVMPLYGLYLLLKDIIHFYFTIYTPGFPGSLFTPSFVLAGITFSPDESPEIKKRVYAYQYRKTAINFLIPFSAEKREKYFEETVENTNGEIIPRSRQWHELLASEGLPVDADRKQVEHFNTAFGLARTLDRKLVEEVATTETSMVRHVLYLRRLVLRYVSTLMMFVWATLVAFIMLAFVSDDRLPVFLLMGIGYAIWALFTLPIMHWPIHWIYRHRKGQVDQKHVDRQLTVFERQMQRFVYAAVALSVLGAVLSVGLYT